MKVLFVSLFVVFADQLTKLIVKGLHVEWLGISFAGMPLGSSRQLIGNFAKITFIENPGMAFGILISPRILLPIIIFLASIGIVYYLFRHRHDVFTHRLALALIIAGALGNLIDRSFYGLVYGYAPFFHGRVVDFIQIEFWDFTIFGRTFTTWPVLNIADLSAVCGFFIILFSRKKIFAHEQSSQMISASGITDDSEDDSSSEETRLRIPDVINHISPNHN